MPSLYVFDHEFILFTYFVCVYVFGGGWHVHVHVCGSQRFLLRVSLSVLHSFLPYGHKCSYLVGSVEGTSYLLVKQR